ncbi:MAG: hypothetical protein H6933_10560 [Burkholderiaceae bacterium]|nr:hypothetical protein [Burkholderiaceae bacterium]
MAIIPLLNPPLARWLAGLSLVLALPVEAAEAYDPGRVGRIVDLRGDVALYDEQYGEWSDAQRNRPLVAGDRLVLQRSARAEVRVGGTVLLLGEGADVAIDTLDDDRLRLTLYDGSLALRVPSRDAAESTEVRTVAALVRPQAAGRYRVDQDGESTFAAAWRGALEVSGHGHLLLVGAGDRHEVWRDDRRGDSARSRVARMPQDRFADWADERFDDEDRRDARREGRYPGPAGIPGIEDLDANGRWDSHPEYGSVWVPYGVRAGWAPFTDGRWVWMRPWGWTWVDAQPWAYATSHYGRWVQWRSRWVWWPGPRHVRPVFAPAVVAWVGGSHFSIGIEIGSRPPAAWQPLPPWQPYVPIVAPRPPMPPRVDVRPPPRRLPPPSEPISRQPGWRGGASTVSTQPGMPMTPGSVRYGTDGVASEVRAVPSTPERPAERPAVPMPVTRAEPAGRPPRDDARPAQPERTDRPDRSDRLQRDDRPAEAAPPKPPRLGDRAAPPDDRPRPAQREASQAPRPAPFSAPARPEATRPAPASKAEPENRPARESRNSERVR